MRTETGEPVLILLTPRPEANEFISHSSKKYYVINGEFFKFAEDSRVSCDQLFSMTPIDRPGIK